jgi:polysaccharide deacetylase family protein (PEP-CTERM system associated)
MTLGNTAPTAHFFTVDVEEYFQVSVFDDVVERSAWDRLPSRVEANVDVLLELLERHRTVGTFFTLGWIADRKPALVRRIAAAGHEIASHGWWHRRVSKLRPPEFREEIRRSKSILEDVSGQGVVGFRAPSFSIVPGVEWAFDVLLEEGYRYDSSLFPIRRPDYGYPSAATVPHHLERAAGSLLELPMATTTIGGLRFPAAGGGYLRQLPYGIIARAFRQQTAAGLPAMFYIHPWEIDPDQPRLAAPMVARWRHYRGLERTLPRIERLLREFRFTSVARHFAIPDGPSAHAAWTRVAV